MDKSLGLLLFIFIVSSVNCLPYKEKYFEQLSDHFNFLSYGNQTFQQRYLINDDYWSKGKGPIFFYTGNEGAITGFWENTGFIFDIAPYFQALIVFAEHRFYGKSLPFGNQSFEGPYIGLLTIEQALADFAILLTHLKRDLNATECPAIAFGGSYGGILSAYMRIKYPNVIDGAIAASAPVLMMANQSALDFFFEDVSKDFKNVSPQCENTVKQAFKDLNVLAQMGEEGLKNISATFKLCAPLKKSSDYRHLQGWIRNSFTYLAMMDYPYPTSFMGNLPANPVNVSCDLLSKQKTPMQGLAEAAGIFYNGTSGNLTCYDIFEEFVECADPTGCGLGSDSKAWDYQACTEIILPAGSNNKTDMFPELPFTTEMRNDYCYSQWKVIPRNEWIAVEMWGRDLKMTSNIVFSNGDLDPWRRGGVMENISDTVQALIVKGGAHHLDLRGHNSDDPPSVRTVRKSEVKAISQWIAEFQKNHHQNAKQLSNKSKTKDKIVNVKKRRPQMYQLQQSLRKI